VAQDSSNISVATAPKPLPKVAVPKNGTNPNFGMNMPMMSSAFDTAAWLAAA
jgi:IMP dehydrogenase/GMP reductase